VPVHAVNVPNQQFQLMKIRRKANRFRPRVPSAEVVCPT
jgi:hypothetical protein